MDTAISVQGVGKRFWHHPADRPRTWKDAALGGFRHLRSRQRFWALKDVSFDVARGSTVGLMGPNGAGKSTLLRLIGGVGRPDEGHIHVRCSIGAITELGTSFNPELTGRESVSLTGVIGGLTRRRVRSRFGDIVAFAELEDFIDEPIRTYSSGMVARLSFAIAIHVDADLLLVDEVLAVGDIGFQQRCIERLKQLQRSGMTMVVVSHDPQLLSELCDEALWLRGGRVVAGGPPEEITGRYQAAMAEQTRGLTPRDVPDDVTASGVRLRVHENRFGTQEARITDVRIIDAHGHPLRELRSGGPLTIAFETSVPLELGEVRIGVHLLRADGVICMDVSSTLSPDAHGRERRSGRLDIERLDLAEGEYAFDVGVYSADWERTYDYHVRAYPLRVSGPHPGSGTLAPPVVWSTDGETSGA